MLKTGKTARAHLKACTDSAHQRLHEQPQFFRLQHGTSSLEDYVGLMAALLSFYRALDGSLIRASNRYLGESEDYRYQPRAPMIKADAAAVSKALKLPPRPPHHIVHCEMPVIENRSALAGAIYVVDGATLGGRLLNKSAAKLLGAEEVNGRSYWMWCETHGASQWKAALALIDQFGSTQAERDDMAASALATFTALERHLAARASDHLAGAA